MIYITNIYRSYSITFNLIQLIITNKIIINIIFTIKHKFECDFCKLIFIHQIIQNVILSNKHLIYFMLDEYNHFILYLLTQNTNIFISTSTFFTFIISTYILSMIATIAIIKFMYIIYHIHISSFHSLITNKININE